MEREDFRVLTKSQDPSDRLKLAEAFLAAYPQSWVLAQVYAIASNGAMEIGRYDLALDYGKDSLQILPEDPLLLVPLASLEARQGDFDLSDRDCREALDEFDRLLPPASVPEADWPERKAPFAGDLLFQSRQGRGDSRARQCFRPSAAGNYCGSRSTISPVRARFNSRKMRKFPYLAGLAQLSLNNVQSASEEFAAAYRLGGPIAPRALEQLKKIHNATAERLRL